MNGTILNVITVAIGGLLGLIVGNRLSDRVQESVITGLGLVTLYVGISNAGETGNVIIPLLSIAIGVIIGELLRIDRALENFGAWLQKRFAQSSTQHPPKDKEDSPSAQLSPRERFITGFVTASLVFCVGPLTFVGSIQDGMGLDIGFQQLAIKSTLDGFAAMAFATSFGVGVLFSIVTIIILQGGLALLGSVLVTLMTEDTVTGSLEDNPMIAEMTATGGLLLIGLSLILLNVSKPRVANFLPALVIAPLLIAVADVVGINVYPI